MTADAVADPDDRPVPADAIVVAAGSSSRMSGTDKLATPIGGRPLLAWTLRAIADAPGVERIILVTAAARVAELRDARWLPGSVAAVVAGGARRHESVAAGLDALDQVDRARGPGTDADGRVVLVHDGARPCVPAALVASVARAAQEHGAAIPVVPVAETLKRVTGGLVAETVDRSTLALAQTPQGVRRGLLRDAFRAYPPGGPPTWTDEAALLEACRIRVHAIPGAPGNLKVTLPDDLRRAELTLIGRVAPRVGFGHDSHPFGPGAPLALGGIEIPGAPRLHGHSDGDVVLHAVADALLGAAGLGDLGRLFPADDRTPRGIASRELLAAVRQRLRDVDLRPVGVDLTITAARPRLGHHLEAMRAVVAGLLDVDPAAVNVKASTGNLDGSDGAGRGISAEAVAVLEPTG